MLESNIKNNYIKDTIKEKEVNSSLDTGLKNEHKLKSDKKFEFWYKKNTWIYILILLVSGLFVIIALYLEPTTFDLIRFIPVFESPILPSLWYTIFFGLSIYFAIKFKVQKNIFYTLSVLSVISFLSYLISNMLTSQRYFYVGECNSRYFYIGKYNGFLSDPPALFQRKYAAGENRYFQDRFLGYIKNTAAENQENKTKGYFFYKSGLLDVTEYKTANGNIVKNGSAEVEKAVPEELANCGEIVTKIKDILSNKLKY
jgi:hypothetical protein